MPFNPDDFAPKPIGFNPDEFLPSEKSGFNPDDFLPKEQAQGFNPDGFLPVTQNDFKAALGNIRDVVVGAVKEQVRSILPPASTPSPLVYEPGADPFKGMKELGSAAREQAAGLEISPEQNKALEDFTVENFKGIVLYPAAITGAAQAVGWYIANKTLPGSIRAAREAVTRALKANGVPEAEASRMADEGMTQAVAKAQAAGAEPGIPEFVALRKAAQRGITPREGTPNVPAPAEPVAQPARPVEEPLFPVEAKAPEAAPAPATAQPKPPFPSMARSTERDLMLDKQIETAKAGLSERPTAPVEGWKSEPVQGGGTSLESPSGYRVFVPEGQDPAKAAAAIREIERAEYGTSQIPEAQAPIEAPLFEGEQYAQKTGAQVEGAGQEVAPVEGPGSGVYLRDTAKDGVESAKGEVTPPPSEPPPPTPPVAEKPMSDDDWVAKFRKDLASAKPEVDLQNMMYSEERAKRFAQATQNYALAGGGIEGFKSAFKAMKGELEKRAFESLTKAIPPEGVDQLARMIAKSPNLKTWGDRLSAFDGLQRIMEGRLPQEGQIAKLEKVFGKELADEIIKKRPMFKRAYDLGLQIVNVPRSLMASMDLSAPFRQGVFFVGRPQFWGKAWPDMIKSLKSEADFKALQEAIENDPDYPMLKEKGLDLTGMSTVHGEREEDFAVPIVERALNIMGVNVNLPGRIIRASGRAYVAFLNKLRLDVAKSLLKSAEESGFKPTEDLVEKIVKYVNAGTGRGGLGPLQGAATSLNAVFFSPRLMASRVNLMTKLIQPSFYEKNNAFIRQQYWRDALSFLAFGSTLMGVAKMAGADVGLDPRSSDFGKIKIGNTRVDVWGGFQQYARMLGQLVAGEYVSSITGKVMTLGEGYKPLTRKDILQRQVESKLSPTASFLNAMMKQQDWEGKPVSAKKEALDRITPLAARDLFTVAQENPELLPLSALGLVGFGVQTYGDGKPVDYRKMSQSMSFQDLAKTLEITEDPKARTQLFRAAVKKFPAAIRKAEDKEEVKRIRARMVEEYQKKK